MSISIVMLSFNQLEFLARAIDSVLSQDSVKLQLIIVDPGSTDGSRELAQEIASQDNRVILIFEADTGPADGLNKGFERAESEIVGYLNSDDIYLPAALKIVEAKFKFDPDIDIIYAHGIILDERIGRKLQFAYSDPFSKTTISTGTARIMQQSTFFRKASLEESRILFNTKNNTCWDYEFIIDAFLAGLSIVRLEDIFGVLRIHSNSITGSNLNFTQYEADRSRMRDIVCSRLNVKTNYFHFLFSIGYRTIRKLQVFAKRISLRDKIEEFSKIENISFME